MISYQRHSNVIWPDSNIVISVIVRSSQRGSPTITRYPIEWRFMIARPYPYSVYPLNQSYNILTVVYAILPQPSSDHMINSWTLTLTPGVGIPNKVTTSLQAMANASGSLKRQTQLRRRTPLLLGRKPRRHPPLDLDLGNQDFPKNRRMRRWRVSPTICARPEERRSSTPVGLRLKYIPLYRDYCLFVLSRDILLYL